MYRREDVKIDCENHVICGTKRMKYELMSLLADSNQSARGAMPLEEDRRYSSLSLEINAISNWSKKIGDR